MGGVPGSLDLDALARAGARRPQRPPTVTEEFNALVDAHGLDTALDIFRAQCAGIATTVRPEWQGLPPDPAPEVLFYPLGCVRCHIVFKAVALNDSRQWSGCPQCPQPEFRG